MPEPPQQASQNLRQSEIAYQRNTDGRYFHRSGRKIQFNTRVTPDFDHTIREIARHEGNLMIDILEKSLVAYCKEINWKGDLNNIRGKSLSSDSNIRIQVGNTHTHRERERAKSPTQRENKANSVRSKG